MHGQVSCLVGCLACRGSVWTPCMPLLYQSCKVKHYLLKTMYFFVQTRSHREYRCSRLGLQCYCSGLKPPPPRLLPASPTEEHLFRKTEPERALDPHAWVSMGLFSRLAFDNYCSVPTGWVSPGRTWTGSHRAGCQTGGAAAGGRAGSVTVSADGAFGVCNWPIE